ADWTYANIETQAASFRRYATSFDWSRRLQTCDPAYYHWNQWLFLRFYERGLAYRRDGYVNWCPVDQTVLANEQVIAGKCERCGADVVRRMLNQWYFKITEYADRLLADAKQLEDCWPDRVLLMQRNWIGRSEGAEVHFTVEGRSEPVTVFTTRPDTLYGATFFVVAADAPLAAELCAPDRRGGFAAYVEQGERVTDIDRLSEGWDQTAGFLGRYSIFPGTGVTIPGDGVLVNSGALNGLPKEAAIAKIVGELEASGEGRAAVNYRLRDWLVSRQRFWGAPIPIVHCPGCGEVPVPEDELPVRLPE